MGFFLVNSKDCNFSNCIMNNNQYGLISMLTNNTHLSLNEFNNNNIGIYMSSSFNNFISNNSFNFHEIRDQPTNFFDLEGGFGLFINDASSDNMISDNILRDNDLCGIQLGVSCNNNTIQNASIGYKIILESATYPEDGKTKNQLVSFLEKKLKMTYV